MRIYVAGLLAMGMISAVAALTTQTASAADHTISIKNVQFNPNSLTINVGDSVTWVNNETDGTVHSTTSDDGLWNSPDLSAGNTYSFTFTTAGTFTFHCRFHTAMTGTITVVGGGGSPPPPPPPPSSTTPPPVTTTAPSTTEPTSSSTVPTSPSGSTTSTTEPSSSSSAPVPGPPTTPSPTNTCVIPPGASAQWPPCLISPPLCVPLLGSILPTQATSIIIPTCVPPPPINIGGPGSF